MAMAVENQTAMREGLKCEMSSDICVELVSKLDKVMIFNSYDE